MFGDLPFFLVLLSLSCGVLAYKALSRQFPQFAFRWWDYGFTVLLISVSSWMVVYSDDVSPPLFMFVLCYGVFMLVRMRRLPRWLGVCLTLVPLLTMKLFTLPFISMLGISFTTFRAVDALLMTDSADTSDIGEYFIYLFFPPALLAGPMYRWRNFRTDLSEAYGRISVASILDGWERLLLGIVQKFALAQLIDICVLRGLDVQDYSVKGMLANAFGYSAFLYFDFAGYSNMAIGAARLFGFHLPENFNNPVASSSPQDFWRRWHVSLSEWLRDVVFIPLYKYLSPKRPFAQHRVTAQNLCILATLFLMGTWNGFQPGYICSGLLFGLYSIIYNDLVHAAARYPTVKALFENPRARFAGQLLTLFLAVIALYVFSGRSPIH